MIISCKNIMKLPNCDKLEIIAGKNGQNKTINWFHYMEDPGYINFLNGGELILTTGIFMQDSTKKYLSFINNLYDNDAVGLIINLSPYTTSISKEIIELGDFLEFPIFILPAEARIIDISQSICKAIFSNTTAQSQVEHFLMNLIYEKIPINVKNINKANQYGYSQEFDYYTISISVSSINGKIISKSQDDYEYQLAKNIEGKIYAIVDTLDLTALTLTQNNTILLLLPRKNETDLDSFTKLLKQSLNKTLDIAYIKIGISPIWKSLINFKTNYDKSIKALKLANATTNFQIVHYNDLGIFKILYEVSNYHELESLRNKILIPLDSELISTLTIYIKENCNLINTANNLFIHVNTLRYRIKKIENILQMDMRNVNDLFVISLALNIDIFLNEYND